jgi:hypothetical protein
MTKLWPNLEWPAFPPWMLFAIGAAIYGRGAFLAWLEERGARLRVEAELATAVDALEKGRLKARQFDIDVSTGGYYAVADDATLSGVWVIYRDVVITNRSEQNLPLELRVYIGMKADGTWMVGQSCETTIPAWALVDSLQDAPFGLVVNLPPFEAESGFCAARFPQDIVLQAGVKDAKELVETRPFWLEVKNRLTDESYWHAMNFIARRVDHDRLTQSGAPTAIPGPSSDPAI